MLVNFKTDIRYREEIPDRMEIFDASVLMQSVIEENSIALSAEATCTCMPQHVYAKVQTQNANFKIA